MDETQKNAAPVVISLDYFRDAWNSQADEYNQWGDLSGDECVEFVLSIVVGLLTGGTTAIREPINIVDELCEQLERRTKKSVVDYPTDSIIQAVANGVVTPGKREALENEAYAWGYLDAVETIFGPHIRDKIIKRWRNR